MEPQIVTQDSLVLPTGATTGERIEINVNDSGLINIYNAANQLVTTIGGSDGSVFVTNGTSTFVKLVDGKVEIGGYAGGVPDFTNSGLFNFTVGAPGTVLLQSNLDPTDSLTDRAQMNLFPGAAGLTPPQATFKSASGTEPIYVQVNGFVVSASNSGVTDTWLQIGAGSPAPNYGANWSSSTTFNGLTGWQPLTLRRLPNDTAILSGAFKTGATLPTNPVFIVPTALRPQNGAWPVNVIRNTGGTLTQGVAYISTSGNVDLFASAGCAIVANSEYLINGVWPVQMVL